MKNKVNLTHPNAYKFWQIQKSSSVIKGQDQSLVSAKNLEFGSHSARAIKKRKFNNELEFGYIWRAVCKKGRKLGGALLKIFSNSSYVMKASPELFETTQGRF